MSRFLHRAPVVEGMASPSLLPGAVTHADYIGDGREVLMRFGAGRKCYAALFDDEFMLRCEKRSRQSSTGLSWSSVAARSHRARRLVLNYLQAADAIGAPGSSAHRRYRDVIFLLVLLLTNESLY